MPFSFICNECGAEVHCTTIFSPMSFSLGDNIVFTNIQEAYLKDNPDERVLFLTPPEGFEIENIVKRENPAKIFWADLTSSAMPESLKTDPRLIPYSVIQESNHLSEHRKIYPRIDNRGTVPEYLPETYIVLHARNIAKLPWKNMHRGEFLAILEIIKDWSVVLVGNDEEYGFEGEYSNLIDLRKSLAFDDLCSVLQKAEVLIARDSGLAHLKGAVGGKVLAYGYKDDQWTPKQRANLIQSFGETAADFFLFYQNLKKWLAIFRNISLIN